MIKEILQFLKKQSFAIKLARYDCLLLIENLLSFNRVVNIARFFVVKSPLSGEERIRKFLEAENNPILFALAQEFEVNPDSVDSKVFYIKKIKSTELAGEVLFKSAHGDFDKEFYLSLYEEVIEKDFPKLKEQIGFFKNRLDVILDMRFYGAIFETLQDDVRDCEKCCIMNIDWIKSSKEELYICFDSKCVLTQELNINAQKNLSRLFAHLLFEKQIFVSYWEGVFVSSSDNVSFADFDYIYPADTELKNMNKGFKSFDTLLRKSDFKLRRALKLLQSYCKDINVFNEFEDFLKLDSNKKPLDSKHGDSFMKALQRSGLDLQPKNNPESINPSDIAYLLDDKRHKNNPDFRKSSVFYWGPLLVLIYILYKFF